MRATDLGFRSPKERTPDPYCPQVTSDGRYLAFSPRQIRGGLIGTEPRFAVYAVNSRKTGYRVGPGTYEIHSADAVPTAVRYRPLHMNKDTSSNAYYMVGNHLIYDAHWAFDRKSLPEKDLNCRVDVRSALSHTVEGKLMLEDEEVRVPSTREVSIRRQSPRRRATCEPGRRSRTPHLPTLMLRSVDVKKALEVRLSQ